MARPEVQQLIRSHGQRLRALEALAAWDGTAELRAAARALADRETEKTLEAIDVEQLQREAPGLRLAALREAGYDSFARLRRASPSELAAVEGISEEGAAVIKRHVNIYASTVRDHLRLRLSADERSPESDRLVSALMEHKSRQTLAREARDLLAQHRTVVEGYIQKLAPAQSTFRWLTASRREREEAIAAAGGLLALENSGYARRSQELLAPLPATEPEAAWAAFARDSAGCLALLEEHCPGLFGGGGGQAGLPEELAGAVAAQSLATEGLKCQLRRYQQWGVRYILRQERVLLGDEMGLGKTVQAIAAMVCLRNAGEKHFLVVCPASVLSNWCREIGKHSDLKAFRVHAEVREEALARWTEEGGVAVTTFETTGHFPPLEEGLLAMLVVDEAHYIKNPKAQRSKNVKTLCAQARRLLFMTGTPLENRVEEMIELIRLLQPKLVPGIKALSFMAAAPHFREKVAPVYYRRKREEVLTELPELIESFDWCELSKEEERLYEQAVWRKKQAEARRVSWTVEDLENSCKARRLREIREEAREEGRRLIVFSFFLDTLEKLRLWLGEDCMEPITGAVPPARRQEILDEFERTPGGTVLPAQILSGGTGLNIQCASVVVLCEPQFKPSAEQQAIARAYRMGQSRNVLVHRLLCEDTVDEKILDMLEQKQACFDAFADDSAAAEESRALDEKNFGDILGEEYERIRQKYGGVPPFESEE